MSLLNHFAAGGVSIDLSSTDYAPTAGSSATPFAVYVGGAGDVKIDTIEGDAITVTAVAGATLPWAAKKVYRTGTTATALHSLRLTS